MNRKRAALLKELSAQPWAMHPNALQTLCASMLRNGNGADLIAGMPEGWTPGLPTNLETDGQEILAATLSERMTPAQDRKIAAQQGGIMVLPINGVVLNRATLADQMDALYFGGTFVEKLKAQLAAAVANTDVKAIVLDVNSPGGTVSGVPELSQAIFEARAAKPIIAQVDAYSFSAAYWLASAAKEVVLTPSGEVGSVGVYSMHMDASKFMDTLGIKMTFIKAGAYKTEGNPYEPLDPAAQAAMQTEVDHYYSQFLDGLARNRGTTSKKVEAGYGQGRALTAQAALDAGMVDRLGTMQETLARLGVSLYSSSSNRRTGMALSDRAREVAVMRMQSST